MKSEINFVQRKLGFCLSSQTLNIVKLTFALFQDIIKKSFSKIETQLQIDNLITVIKNLWYRVVELGLANAGKFFIGSRIIHRKSTDRMNINSAVMTLVFSRFVLILIFDFFYFDID